MSKNLLSAKGLEAAVKAATADAQARNTRLKVRDGDNLMLVVRANGASWVLQYRLNGQRRPLTLGPYPAVSLKLARELADQARAQVAQGVDPLKAKAAQRVTTKAKQDTVRALFTDWTGKKRSGDVYLGNIEAAFVKDVLPAIGAMHPAEVTRQDVLRILRTIEARNAPVMLRRVRMWLKQMYEAALDDDRVPASPVPTGHLASFMEATVTHFPAITNPQDVPDLMRAILAYDKPVVRAALLFSAHTWQRPSEIREADWSEFDLDAARWVIPASRMKMGREHWVPLSPQALELLRQHQGVVGSEGWVFPGKKYGKPVSEATLGKALDKMGYKGRHTPHGFRAMARTIMDEHLGVDTRYLEKQLAHEEADKVKRAYSRAEHMDGRVKMMAQWSSWLVQQAS
jgi:integrase